MNEKPLSSQLWDAFKHVLAPIMTPVILMEPIAALSILVPIILPLLLKVGIDPLHFGMIIVLNLMLGLLTPPYKNMLSFITMRT